MTSWDTLQNVGSCVECYVKYIPATDILQNDPEVFRDFPLPVDRVDDIIARDFPSDRKTACLPDETVRFSASRRSKEPVLS
jgi:hypothetical protein